MINGKRVAKQRKALGLSQDGLGELIGMSGAMVGKLERGEASNTAKVFDLARALQTSPNYLMDETDDPTSGALPRITPQVIAEQLDVVQLPMLNLKYGMGGGTVVDNEQAELIPMSRKWLRTFTNSDPANLFMTRGTGDSMAPTILHEDMLIGDRSQNQVLMGDQIWAITHYGAGLIKRLRPMEGGYRILSDNSAVPMDTATDGSMQIVGRIIYVMRGI